MLAAFWDYLQYRLRILRYSAGAIEGQGAKLATANNFPEISTCQAADVILLHTRGSLLSWGVMYYTASVWSHVGLFAENGQVIDATTGGLVEHEFLDYCDGYSYIQIVKPAKKPRTSSDDARWPTLEAS